MTGIVVTRRQRDDGQQYLAGRTRLAGASQFGRRFAAGPANNRVTRGVGVGVTKGRRSGMRDAQNDVANHMPDLMSVQFHRIYPRFCSVPY